MAPLPRLGVGVSYRPKWREAVLAHRDEIGCLEIIAEHYLDAPPEKLDELDQLHAQFPLIPHGIGLSFGTDAPLDEAHLRRVARLVERLQPAWFTEHMAFTRVHGWNLGHLVPLPLTREAVAAVCRNVRRWREATGVPLLLENITAMVVLPGELTEAQFLTEVVERSGCGLLLDLHNLYTNAVNHGYDPDAFLEGLPLERVAQIHLGGGHEEDGYRIDSHSAATPEPVWELLRHVAARTRLGAVIVEWDVKLPPFDVIRREMATAAAILRGETDGSARSAERAGAPLHR
jgi:uncharacterized protein (UPF0276 family)